MSRKKKKKSANEGEAERERESITKKEKEGKKDDYFALEHKYLLHPHWTWQLAESVAKIINNSGAEKSCRYRQQENYWSTTLFKKKEITITHTDQF